MNDFIRRAVEALLVSSRPFVRLAVDGRGNAMPIMAAALIPLLGMIGSGLDISRVHLVKSKMQTACDASALAARRAMATATLDQSSIDEGKKFFNFNFPPGTMQATPVALSIQANATDISTVDVTASTQVPTTIMRLFGFTTLGASVACSADQDYVNNDIMLVLDVTGSMNCRAGANCDYAATEQNGSRLSRLRGATSSLYSALEGAKGVRTRYGFMPYSMTFNVGKDLNSSWLRNPAGYWQQQGNNNWTLKSVTHPNNWFNSWEGCIEERSTISQGAGASIRISSDVAKDDIDTTGTTQALQWQPYDDQATEGESGAYTNLAKFCPARASRLDTYDSESDFQDAVDDSLDRVGGYTNHDLGIMWGMRFLSGTGMFATDNPDTFNQVPVGRHIIFLTDGVMTADTDNYSSFGVPRRGDRMTGGGSLVKRHQDRFLNACNRARQMGMTIWVIALDVQSPNDIKPCASGEDHFFISDGSDLDQVFTRIAKGIGRLRLTV
jgi:Flp pilus assembly protein TadG